VRVVFYDCQHGFGHKRAGVSRPQSYIAFLGAVLVPDWVLPEVSQAGALVC